MDARTQPEIFLFGHFGLDRRGRGLFRYGDGGSPVPVNIGSRALDVFGVLVDRRGELVTKDEIMAAVWPGTVVEGANLAVQISALRRVLDEDRTDGSCILTVPGRGYRFIGDPPRLAVSPSEAEVQAAEDLPSVPRGVVEATTPAPRRRLRATIIGVALFSVAAVGGALAWIEGYKRHQATAEYPPLSIVVLPFENLSGDRSDDYLADAITDDLTSDLSHIPNAFVIARGSAYMYKDRPRDMRTIGEELGVRYVVTGSVRGIGSTLRVNAHLTSTETGADLWSDRFDEQISELSTGQERIVTRMRSNLGIGLVEVERARSLREHPTNPDAFDLILRARFLFNQPRSQQRFREACTLFERALMLDPSSDSAMAMIAKCLIEGNAEVGNGNGFWGAFDDRERTAQLLARAGSIAPDSEEVLGATLEWLNARGRCQEEIELARQLIERFPNNSGYYRMLGNCEILTGHSEEDISLVQKSIQLDPRTPYLRDRYGTMGSASLWLGRDDDAIRFLQQALALEGDNRGLDHWIYTWLGAAYARTGRMDEAKQALAKSKQLWPFDTVRGHWPDFALSEIFANQIKHYQEGLRLAGERDHADEDADFGVSSDRELHSTLVGFTPRDAPGTTTIRTSDFFQFLTDARPVVIDTMTDSWGRSIPGAIGLASAGSGGGFADVGQECLRIKMRELTEGDFNRPIVAVGWNSERFDGRNLALRLTALGYTKVYWYRGGREAWEANGLPETRLEASDW
jgi:TolB-like protein/DNA-binding winged helix-turn-helix (wHTH) protein/rhodanese-related sulfurtransferase